jgi:hypothetical protein
MRPHLMRASLAHDRPAGVRPHRSDLPDFLGTVTHRRSRPGRSASATIEIEQLALPLRGRQAAKSLLVPYAESPTALAGASR